MNALKESVRTIGAHTPDNPFCTSRVRPGAIEFQFPHGDSATDLLRGWERQGKCGAIIGPHGSGKSTLLATLLPMIEAAGHKVHRVSLTVGQRNPLVPWSELRPAGQMVLVIDGFEQVPVWRRVWFQVRSQLRGMGLLVTSHRPVLGLPTLYDATGGEALAQELARRLLAGFPPLIQPADVAACWKQQPGNLRETFFAVYDLYEARKPNAAARPSCRL